MSCQTWADSRRYLLTSAKSTILTPLQGHYDIAFACVAYLARCTTDLLEHKQDTSAALVSVAEGFHSLQQYANSFWSDHFLEFAVLNADMRILEMDPIMTQMKRLHAISDMYSSLPPTTTEIASNGQPDTRVSVLAQCGDVRFFLRDTLNHRQNLSRRQEKTSSKYYTTYVLYTSPLTTITTQHRQELTICLRLDRC